MYSTLESPPNLADPLTKVKTNAKDADLLLGNQSALDPAIGGCVAKIATSCGQRNAISGRALDKQPNISAGVQSGNCCVVAA